MPLRGLKESLLWREYTVGETEFLKWEFGDLTIWCKRRGEEIWTTWKYGEVKDQAEPQEDDDWLRCVPKSKSAKIRLSPAFPDRPLVVHTEGLLSILKDARIRILVVVPVWVRLETVSKSVVLTEIPTVRLSKTWFGTPSQGEKCYWVSSPAQRSLEAHQIRAFDVVCPVRIVNGSDSDLSLRKLALRVRRLSIFEKDGYLWADETRINYRGEAEVSSIHFSRKAPPEAENAKLIAAPRKDTGRGFASKTFASLRELSGFGPVVD